MVKTTKEREHHAAAPHPSGAGEITVRNLYRHRPVSFHYLGGSARLGPLEARRLGRGSLASPELTHLVSIGAVSVSDATGPATAGPDERRHHASSTRKEH